MYAIRSYYAITKEAAAEELVRCAGSHFDPLIVNVFTEKVLPKLDMLAGFRITSYNVCYTKLLRAQASAPSIRRAPSSRKHSRCNMKQSNLKIASQINIWLTVLIVLLAGFVVSTFFSLDMLWQNTKSP